MSQWSWYARGLEGERRFQHRDPHDLYREHLEHELEEFIEHSRHRHGYALGFEVPEPSEFEVQIRERKGPKNYQRSDSRILDDIAERLIADSSIDCADIEVEVNDGEAQLAGTVPERWMKRRAELIAEGVAGVSDVQNRIRVKKPA